MSDPTRFDLDERQRAMLAEMGVRVWWPQAPVEAAPAPAVTAQVAQRPAPVQVPRPVNQVVATLPDAAVPLPAVVGQMDWDSLQATVAECTACGLCQGRKGAVFGVGERNADWMVIGEAPDEQEDLQGEPFVDQSGKLLDNMLKAIGLSRQAQGPAGVYVTNILKCRPSGSRNPEPLELQTCAPYLERQVALVQPKIILAMGRFAVQSLLQSTEPIGKLRGRVHQAHGVPVVVTYHPAYLLRNPADKAKAWADLLLALKTVQG